MDLETILENFDAIVELPNGIEQVRSLFINFSFDLFSQKWEWEHFSSVVFYQEGPGIRQWEFTTNGVKILNIKNIVQNKLRLELSNRYVSEKEFNQKYQHFLIKEGDLIFASSGSSWGKTAVFADPGYKVILNTSTIRMRSTDKKLLNNFLYYFLMSDLFKKQMQLQLHGLKPNFGSSHLSKILIPILSLLDQQTIIDQLFNFFLLCDRAQQAKQARDELYKKLASTKILA